VTATPVALAGVPRRRRPPPLGLFAAALAVAGFVFLPLAFLILQASQVGWHTLSPLLFRHLTGTLLVNTVRLTGAVTVICAVLGVAAAWVVERTDVPFRRSWRVVLVLPLAVPDFVLAYSWITLTPSVQGYWGSVLVMSLGSYPLVYLPVAAALRRADPSLEEVARGLGLGRFATFRRVTLQQIRPALVGGSLLVALILLAEFGTFEILRFQTFTTEIYTEFRIGFNTPAGCALSLVLVLLGLIILGGEGGIRGRGGASRRGVAARPPALTKLGPARVPVSAALLTLLGLAIGVPVYALAHWFVQGTSSTLPSVSILHAALWTAFYSASAGAIATLAALPVALLAERRRGPASLLVERSTYLVQALPGIVIGLSFAYFSVRYAFSLYQSSLELILAYAIMFFPLALVTVRAGVAQAPPGLEEVARSLGHRRLSVLARVTLPILAPSLAAGFSLVFIAASTELTATLILHPTGIETLATDFFNYENNFAYGAAAPYALALLLVALIPGLVLGRWFERVAGGRAA
jgi:iron(III) transport system permease protein